jgi:hypothetical protein
MIPVPLVVYERLVGALAADVEAAEEEEDRRSERDARGGFAPNDEKKALLSAETAHAAVTSLADVAGSLVEFLEHALSSAASVDDKNKTRSLEDSEDDSEDSENTNVFLAATRALSCFLAELPEPHEAKVNKLLPRLFGSAFGDAASRALVVRFTLPYVLQATETPAGLDAFADADGARAVASLARRAAAGDERRSSYTEKKRYDKAEYRALRREARGVVAACVAALRNAADGASRGLADERCGEAAGEAFAELLPDLVRWAEATDDVSDDDGDDGDGDDDASSFARRLVALSADEKDTSLVGASWRDAARVMARLVPVGAALGEGAVVGGGGFLFEREERGGSGDGFDDPIEL